MMPAPDIFTEEAINRDPLTKQDIRLDGEVYVDLFHLQWAMKALNTALVSVVSEIAMARGWRPD